MVLTRKVTMSLKEERLLAVGAYFVFTRFRM
jgi:hypothetical protein